MADRPILFSAPMVLALLREAHQPGTGKTQTRRILRLPKWASTDPTDIEVQGDGSVEVICRATGCLAAPRLPYTAGDRLWVKETWQTGSGFDGPQIAYRATGDCHDIEAWDGEDEGAGPSFNYERCPGAKWHTWLPDLLSGAEGIWRPSLFMPRWASRLTLLVTDVRVERLQDISEVDARAEGVERESADPPFYYVPGIWPHSLTAVGIEEPGGRHAARSFAKLWGHINGPESWQANPWIVAVTFTVHARNIDQLTPADALDIAGAA